MSHGAGGGRPPFGWEATGGGNEAFAPIPAEIAVLRRIRDLRAAGFTYQAIADELNAGGHPTKAGHLWARASVRAALHTIERFGIPKDVNAAIKSAYRITAKKKAGGYRVRKPGDTAA